MSVYQVYERAEDGGYPAQWRELTAEELLSWKAQGGRLSDLDRSQLVGIKDLVRAEAGHRCVRCGHPYRLGTGVMSDPLPEHRAVLEEWGLAGKARLFDVALEYEADALGCLLDRVVLDSARRQHWSACDDGCEHGGPIRFRMVGTEAWGHMEVNLTLSAKQIGLRTPDWHRPVDGLPGQYEIQALWRILTVHHLNGDKLDCRWWNLVGLCQRCHLVIQGKVDMARVFPWEHSDWFKPYAAGWYASSYLGQELTRGQVMARLDELLSLERMA